MPSGCVRDCGADDVVILVDGDDEKIGSRDPRGKRVMIEEEFGEGEDDGGNGDVLSCK